MNDNNNPIKKISVLFFIADISLAAFSALSAFMVPVMTVNAEKKMPIGLVILFFVAITLLFITLSIMYILNIKRNSKSIYYIVTITNLGLLALFLIYIAGSAVQFNINKASQISSEASITESNKLVKPIKITDETRIAKLTPQFNNDKYVVGQTEKNRFTLESIYSYKTQNIYTPGEYKEKTYVVYIHKETGIKVAFDTTLEDMYSHIYKFLFMMNSKQIADEMKSKLTNDKMVITSMYWNYDFDEPSHFYEYNVTDTDNIGITANYKKFSGYVKNDVTPY